MHPSSLALPALFVVFDSDRNAYDAALSEGWHQPEQRAKRKSQAPTIEPASAYLRPTSRREPMLERAVA